MNSKNKILIKNFYIKICQLNIPENLKNSKTQINYASIINGNIYLETFRCYGIYVHSLPINIRMENVENCGENLHGFNDMHGLRTDVLQ